MAVQQIANRLIRTFGEGDALRKVVLETIDGKTYTNVFDNKGNCIQQKVKAFSEEMVGDKLVKTKTVVTKYKNFYPMKFVTEKVYKTIDNIKDFLGIRKTRYTIRDAGLKKEVVFKAIKDDKRGSVNTIYDRIGLRFLKLVDFYPAGIKDGNFYRIGSERIVYNEKGLPYPKCTAGIENSNRSLAEKRKQHYLNNPTETYLPEIYNLKSLDDVSDLAIKPNNLGDLL